jgi:hydroxylamine dehydrogenase
MNRKLISSIVLIAALILAIVAAYGENRTSSMGDKAKKLEISRGLTEVEKSCIDCHGQNEPGKVHDWANSLHARANVTCFDCHGAMKTDKDARNCPGTEKYRDVYISPIVSPGDCSRCHPREFDQFIISKHSRTWEITTDKIKDPWFMGMNSEIERAAGCAACHGSDISDGELTVENWPNQGCGRKNPDGTFGSCVICHTTHSFSIAEARKPETCGSCHLGPDHPQEEIYFESKHGKRYLASGDTWNFTAAPDAWEPSSDYTAPTCAVCHMSGIGALSTTHDVGERLKYEAQAPKSVTNWDHDPDKAREKMLAVCTQCHSPRWANNYLTRYDRVNEHYNTEYFAPIKKIMNGLYNDGILTKWPMFDEKIEWAFYEYWHHEGRRARMGAAMMGPDYSWWHGFYDLKHKYQEIIELAEQARKVGHGNPTFVPGTGPNLTSGDAAPLPESWGDIEHLRGMPE